MFINAKNRQGKDDMAVWHLEWEMTPASLDPSGTQELGRDVTFSLPQKCFCKKKAMFEGTVEQPGCTRNVLIQTPR